MQPHRWLTPLVGLSLTLGGATAATASPPPRPSNPTASTVSLITGDQVRVTTGPGNRVRTAFIPGPGSTSDSALTTTLNGHTYVVPSAAAADVTAGRLDRSLFDVTTLIAEGATDSTPVIIRYAGKASARSAVAGTTGGRVLASLGARATRVSQGEAFWRSLTPGKTARVASTVTRISLDRRVKVNLDQSVPQIGGPAAWQRGFTGKGVKIAVLDTGIDPTHPDVAGRVAAAEDFSESGDAADHHGHGTHVASIAAGNGTASDGKYKGVAPDATLLNGKVLDNDGNGYDSGIIAGMEWATAQGASVVNLSLGGGPSDGTDELSQAVNRISKQTGALFVIAAGNCFRPTPGTVSTPAAADEALAVGNLQRDGLPSSTSCHGPRKGDGALKPELSAPGTDLVAARAAGTSLGEPVDENYTTLSGTSMASPHVAGTAALLAQAHPDWKADALKARLISTADPQQGSSLAEQGAGRVDADQATATEVTVDTGELELGRLAWPYPQTDVVTRELTYRNPTGTPVTLKLAVDLESTQLSADQLVVPANGEAKVTATTDRAKKGPGNFAGRITATADGADPLVTTIGWYAEPEVYELTVTGITHAGGPASGELAVNRLDGPQPELGQSHGVPFENGVAKVRLAPGKYDVSSLIMAAATDQAPGRFDLVLSDEFAISKATALTLDARKTQTLDLGAQGQPGSAAPREVSMTHVRAVPDWRRTDSVSQTGSRRTFAATRTAEKTIGTAEIAFGKRIEQPPYQAQIVGGASFTALDFHFGPRFTGQKELQVFDGGTGTPAELTGAKGKLALIRSDQTQLSGDLAANAEQAGAAAVMLYDPSRAGDGAIFAFWAYTDNGDAKVPTMRISRVNAQRLLERPTTVRVTGQAVTPYVYDLVVPWANRLPADTELTVNRDQLATVDETFGTHTGLPTAEARTGMTPAGADLNSFLLPYVVGPTKRTSYVLANQVSWYGQIVVDGSEADPIVLGAPRVYRPGTKTVERWLTPIINSGLPDADVGPIAQVGRYDGGLSMAISTLSHGPGQFSPWWSTTGDTSIVAHRNGVEIFSDNSVPGGFVEVPPEAADYEIHLKNSPDPALFRYSTTVESHWKFHSKGGEQEQMPLVLADLDVPQANAHNQVPTGRPVTITLGLRHQFGSGSAATFAKPKLQISYDNKHWTTLPLTGSGTNYTAKVIHPVSAAGKSPSLRLTATDADGNSLTQHITAAYGLK
ncbi:S8 family serine peptidase [Kribbella albertanoniae]|uniref:Peptidase S8 n=1 Tax=Kribbella albertanoniae TaxID=1266829 RepID=A0A4R4PWY1_9ACTN|nr:S8 family serine peptidase [Kribbella albertanoniae]TDC27010.1 peptidase S8 [Kribbella albertanoniae]